MIREIEVRRLDLDLRHVTGSAVLISGRTTRSIARLNACRLGLQ